jgi:hypothetical protein
METLRMLEAKYRAVVQVTPDEDLARQVSPASAPEIAITRTPLQGSLF